MADIQMPQLGETVTEGTITKWFKQVGDTVTDHGHPAPDTLELYGRRGALVLRTDECGVIAVVVTADGLGAVC